MEKYVDISFKLKIDDGKVEFNCSDIIRKDIENFLFDPDKRLKLILTIEPDGYNNDKQVYLGHITHLQYEK